MPCAMPPWRWPSASSGLRIGPGVVDGDDPVDHRLARLDIHLDDGDVRAEREGRRTRIEVGVDPQGLPRGQIAQRDRGVGALDDDSAALDDEVVDARLQHVGRTLLGQLRQLARRLVDGDAAGLQAARAHRAAPRGIRSVSPCFTVIFSIGMSRCSLASIAQAVACPCPCGDVPVSTVTVPSGCTSTAASSLNAAPAGDLDEHRDADAELHRVATLAPGGLLGAQTGVARRLQHRVERLLVLAGVVGRPALGDQRERLGLQQVAAAHLGRVHADLGGEEVHRALDRRGGLRAPGAAVGRDRRGVRDEHPRPRLDLLDVVDAGRHHAREHRQHGAEPRVGARVLAGRRGGRPAPCRRGCRRS